MNLHKRIKILIAAVTIVIASLLVLSCEMHIENPAASNIIDSAYDIDRPEVAEAVREAQRPLLIGISVLAVATIALIGAIIIKNRYDNRRLEKLVKQRTNELELRSVMLSTLLDSIPAHIFAKDLNLLYTQCNKNLLEHFGISKEDIIGKDDVSGLGVPEETAEKFREIDRRVIRNGEFIKVEEYIPGIGGNSGVYEILKAPLILNDSIIGVLGASFNITERKEMEKTAEDNYKHAKKLSDALAEITKSEAIFAGDLKYAAEIITRKGCLASNVDTVAIWGYSEEKNTLECIAAYNASVGETVKKNDYCMSNDVDYVVRLLADRLLIENNIGGSFPDSYLISNPNICAMLEAPISISGKFYGTISIEQERCEKYPDGREWTMEEQNFASSLADIMALVISNYERRIAREVAETISRYKSDFIASMSHEIRTPMNVILGITEILINDDSLADNVSDGLSKIYNSGDMLLGIINDILDLSKIEAGKLELYLAIYETASLINDTAVLNYMRNESKPVAFTISVNESIPSLLYGDELRIKQILNNLLSNAFKYTDSGEIKLSFDIEFNEDNPQDVIFILKVRDTGQGMTKEQVKTIFDVFTRFNFNANRTKEGTGLGMNITRNLVRMMNGEILVTSEPGKGTEFTVRLPQICDGSERLGTDLAENLEKFNSYEMKQLKKSSVIFEPMPYGRVLVVDDVESNLYVTKGLMSPYELVIDTVNSGFKAIDKIKAGNVYDIIFMDHMMPKMDGIETTKIIREMGYKDVIVALTANALKGQADMFMENGFDDFISKPVDVRFLNTVLKKYIQDKQPIEVLEAVKKKNHYTKKGIRYTEPNPLLSPQYVEFLKSDAQSAISKLEAFINKDGACHAEDFKSLTIAVHSMKSALANVGEHELSATAGRLEKAGWSHDMDMLGDVPDFIGKLKAVITKLEPPEEDDADITLLQSDYSGLKEILLVIKQANEAFDNKTAKTNINALRAKKWPVKIKQLLGEMSEKLLSGDTQEVSNIADIIVEICDKKSVV